MEKKGSLNKEDLITKQSLKKSQATGFRDPKGGCSLSPFSFLGAGCSGNHGRVFKILPLHSRPAWCHDCNLGQHPAS